MAQGAAAPGFVRERPGQDAGRESAQFHSSSSSQAGHSAGAQRDEPDFDSTDGRNPLPEKLLRLADEISSLTVLEVFDLTHHLKKKLGLPDLPMMMVGGGMPGQMAGPAAAAPEEKKPEKTVFDVKLESFDAPSKIKIIKEVRTFTALGLKEAKELVEKTPAVLKKGVSKEEATQMIEKLKAVGGVASME